MNRDRSAATLLISNMDDIIDVRDIIARVEELETERDDCVEAEEGLHADKIAELDTLGALLGDLKSNGGDEQWRGDWYPVTLIRDSNFTDYAEQLIEDIGDHGDLPGYIVIDWEATARNIRVDYSSVEFDGVTYWYR